MAALRKSGMDLLNYLNESAVENEIETNKTTFQESFEKLKSRIMPNVSMRNYPQMKRQQHKYSRSTFNFHAHNCSHCRER